MKTKLFFLSMLAGAYLNGHRVAAMRLQEVARQEAPLLLLYVILIAQQEPAPLATG